MSLPTALAVTFKEGKKLPTTTTTPPATPSSILAEKKAADKKVVRIHFVAVGAAPILKKTRFRISADQRFAAVHVFLRRVLKLDTASAATNANTNENSSSSSSLFLYLHAAFCPGPEELLADLNETFATKRGELVVHYSLQQAWG